MFRIIYLVFVITLLLSDHSYASKLLRWVDKDGVVHITDKPEEIPEEHLGEIEEIDIDRKDYESMTGNIWKMLKAHKDKIIITVILLISLILVYRSIKSFKPKYIKRKKTKLLKLLEKSDIDKLNREDFKAYIGRLLENQGFGIEPLEKEHIDPGIALLAEKNNSKIFVQLKPDYDSVSRLAVVDADREKHRYGCDKAMLITNYYFDEDAIELASEIGCDLVDRVLLAKWIFKLKREQ